MRERERGREGERKREGEGKVPLAVQKRPSPVQNGLCEREGEREREGGGKSAIGCPKLQTNR